MKRLDRTIMFQYIKRCFKIGVLMGGFCGMVALLNYLYNPHNWEMDWHRILWHSYYENAGTIDTIFLGSSHVHCDIDPQMMDELSGKNNFNMSTPNQSLDTAYYLLKQADSDNKLLQVYVEVYYGCVVADDAFYENIGTYQWRWKNIDYMKPSWSRIAYMKYSSKDNHLLDCIFPFIRYRENLFDWDKIRSNLESKHSPEYRSYQRCDRDADGNIIFEYRGKGYAYTTLTNKEFFGGQSKILVEHPIGAKSERYLREIIEYCLQREISITLFVSPSSNIDLGSIYCNYDNYINQVREITSEYGIDFYDFNLAKEQYLDINKATDFRDNTHLNANGVSLFTPFLYEVLTNDREKNEPLFYNSYQEKLENTAPEVYGLYCCKNDDGMITYQVVSNRDNMEYKISIISENGEEYRLQDYSNNRIFSLDESKSGICRIVARMPEEPEIVVDSMETEF